MLTKPAETTRSVPQVVQLLVLWGTLPRVPDGKKQVRKLYKGVLDSIPGANSFLHICDHLLHKAGAS